jgi:4-hydroxythreonine-4-phosphate dehydrogenase
MGDVAGIGPEVIVRGWADPRLHALARPIVIGDSSVLERSIRSLGASYRIQAIDSPLEADPTPKVIPCLDITQPANLADLEPGRVHAEAGRAAHDYLIAAIDLALAGQIDAVTTLPLNKEGLRLAGIAHPGHTEILAERCGVRHFAMMLYLPHDPPRTYPEQKGRSANGLGVIHVTLHVALRDVFDLVTEHSVGAAIRLADVALRPLTGGDPPRVAVAALNPHAGEHGLFGDEEARIIEPAVRRARAEGIDVSGPYPGDSLFRQALLGAYDAVVAMYHDQGHIVLKAVGFDRAVNVTLGLPIVRTSVAHGTAYDIVGRGQADPSSLIEAVRVAARIVEGRHRLGAIAAT